MRRVSLSFALAFLPFALISIAHAATPGFTATTTNVTLSDRGSGTSTVTINSVNGYTITQMQVSCVSPNVSSTEYIVADCVPPTQPFTYTLPANGPVTVTLS